MTRSLYLKALIRHCVLGALIATWAPRGLPHLLFSGFGDHHHVDNILNGISRYSKLLAQIRGVS